MAVKTTLFVEIVMERNFWLGIWEHSMSIVLCQKSIFGEMVILRQLKGNKLNNNWKGNIKTWTQGKSRCWKALHHLVWKFVSNHNSIWLWDNKLTWVFLSFPNSDECQQKWPPAVALYSQPVLVAGVVARRHLVEDYIAHKMSIYCDCF